MKIFALSITALFMTAAGSAYAGPCSKEIEMVTQLLSGGGGASISSLGSAGSAVPSTGTLSAVTGGAGAGAAVPAASPEALESVEQAKQADAAGDETSCMEYISKAKELLGLIQ